MLVAPAHQVSSESKVVQLSCAHHSVKGHSSMEDYGGSNVCRPQMTGNLVPLPLCHWTLLHFYTCTYLLSVLCDICLRASRGEVGFCL